MNRLALLTALLWLFAAPAMAHRLDENLQATIFDVAPGVLHGTLRIAPGVAVAPAVIADMDSNADGVISEQEKRAYVDRVLHELRVAEDGRRLELRSLAASVPATGLMRAGQGELQIQFAADMSSASGQHRLTFDNEHDKAISVYLVNTLVPQDASIRITGQTRTSDQSSYELQFTQSTPGGPVALAVTCAIGLTVWALAARLPVPHPSSNTDATRA